MQYRNLTIVQIAILVSLVILATAIFLNSPGTVDMKLWRLWALDVHLYGAVDGFKAHIRDYPPLTSFILLGAVRVSELTGLSRFEGIKLSIAFFLFLTSFIFWLWTRNVALTLLLHLTLLLDSVALGYLDIYFAPPLVLSIWALKKRRLTLATSIYCIAILIKWQPIIIAPFVALYIINITPGADWRQVDIKNLCMRVLLPAIAIITVVFSIYGTQHILASLKMALSNKYLSGNALNFNWVVTHFLHVFYPDRFGSLVGGRAAYIFAASPKIILIPRLLFYLSYIITLAAFFKREKTLENLILFSLLGYWAYFTFNVGVHENHWFLVTIFSVLLFWKNARHAHLMIYLIMMSNVNLFIFYGIDGVGLRFNRAIGGRIDTALLLSILNVSVFLFYWVANVLLDARPARAARPVEAERSAGPR